MLDFFYTIIIYPLIIILEFSFTFAQKLFKESGLSIVFISFIVSVLCLPLYAIAEKWQKIEREITNKLKAKVDKIKKVFKGDEQYMILTTYYRQNGYHPIYKLRGSFGLLIQIPFFIAAYSFLSHLEILKGIKFLFINDLGSPDKLITINGFIVNLLPILMTLINCISAFIYTKGLPNKDKLQLYGISIIFLVLLYNSPSSLVLYWTMNNIFSVFKNIYYRIQFKYKNYFLLAIFSLICIIFSIIFLSIYHLKLKVRLLSFVLIFISVMPWLYIIFKKYLSLFSIKYNKTITFSIFILSILAIWSLIGLFLPSQLIVSSTQEFSFIDNYSNPLFFLLNTAFQTLGLFVFWPLCLYFLFSANFKNIISFVFFTMTVCMLINTFLFDGNYGQISINFKYDKSPIHTYTEYFFNIFILTIIIFTCFVFFKLFIKRYIPIIISLCLFSLISISVINIYNINKSYNQFKAYYIKPERNIKEVTPIFKLSRNKENLVIIMLDRAISVFIPYIFDESPELKEIYSGFTYYPNTVSFNGYTMISSPALFGGYEYTPLEMNNRKETLAKKHNEALMLLPRILSENNFHVTITDPPYINHDWISDVSIYNNLANTNAFITDGYYTNFYLNEHNLKIQDKSAIIKRNMFWYSFLKTMPLIFRFPMYMSGYWCSPLINFDIRTTIDGYAVLHYLNLLTETTDDNINYALIMTNNATHSNLFLQAPEYIPSVNVTNYGNSNFSKEHMYHTTAAAIKRLSDWFNFLKKKGIYENTRIIIVSDHGPNINFVTEIGLPFNVDQFNPLLMVKDFNSSGELITDMTFMSNADVPFLSLKNLIPDMTNPFTGKIISTDSKNNPLYIAMHRSLFHSSSDKYNFALDPKYDYYVHNNIFAKENWIKVSEY